VGFENSVTFVGVPAPTGSDDARLRLPDGRDLLADPLYVLFFVSLERRRIEFVASTSNPDGRWVAQQARNLLMFLADREQSLQFILHDRDSKFSRALMKSSAART
jgi:hypothetical protein